MHTSRKTAGDHLREWRGKRRMSQLELATEAEISTRHLSFLETGRSQASREMLLHLSEQLDIPLRERNVILVAAGYAPVFEERPLASPEMAAARQAVERVLKGHEPFPALAVDRHWQLVSANAVVAPLLADVDAALLKPPVNVLRLSLHPSGLAPRIANLAEWRAHLLTRLRTQIEQTADAVLIDLLAELSKFPATNMLKSRMPPPRDETAGVFVPLQLVTDAGKLSFLSTTGRRPRVRSAGRRSMPSASSICSTSFPTSAPSPSSTRPTGTSCSFAGSPEVPVRRGRSKRSAWID
jgi:transcriptional regulator with XRE-family HTH domain